VIDGKKVKVVSERDPKKLPWKELNVDVDFDWFYKNKEFEVIAHWFNSKELIEHGSGIGGSWLTDYGYQVYNTIKKYEDKKLYAENILLTHIIIRERHKLEEKKEQFRKQWNVFPL
jgi:hypothetical protein